MPKQTNHVQVPLYLTQREAADAVGVTTRTIFKWTHHKGLQQVVIDGTIRIKRTTLDEFMAKHTI